MFLIMFEADGKTLADLLGAISPERLTNLRIETAPDAKPVPEIVTEKRLIRVRGQRFQAPGTTCSQIVMDLLCKGPMGRPAIGTAVVTRGFAAQSASSVLSALKKRGLAEQIVPHARRTEDQTWRLTDAGRAECDGVVS